ncbi:MAG: hypothetical protein K2M15_05980 [Oscillospiraceae bacterium]|nr:hypothetical protein [Oscillospiraceae bacterium]MDE7171470.1 hypothetical protein [Oscillospiraceae bacterium]
MKLTIDFGNPMFDEETAGALTLSDLDDFYVSASELDRLNLFFELEATFHRYLDAGKNRLAAHLAYLTAYYLFTPLTPPASCALALHYIREALRLAPCPEYQTWLELIEKGN